MNQGYFILFTNFCYFKNCLVIYPVSELFVLFRFINSCVSGCVDDTIRCCCLDMYVEVPIPVGRLTRLKVFSCKHLCAVKG